MRKILFTLALAAVVCEGMARQECKTTGLVDGVGSLTEALDEDDGGQDMVGDVASDFALPAIDGSQLRLSSLRGKYVVLDFWGSWCVWCIKGMPKMKEYYEKYKAKGLEILGIDCRDSEERWKTAVESNALPWLHVRNMGDVDVAALYGIRGFPTKIVVDKEGKIIKVVLGEDPQFYDYLDELFGGK